MNGSLSPDEIGWINFFQKPLTTRIFISYIYIVFYKKRQASLNIYCDCFKYGCKTERSVEGYHQQVTLPCFR